MSNRNHDTRSRVGRVRSWLVNADRFAAAAAAGGQPAPLLALEGHRGAQLCGGETTPWHVAADTDYPTKRSEE
jgi:hypothetical protein